MLSESTRTCPDCFGQNIDVADGVIRCRSCGLAGKFEELKLCERVPVFGTVKEENIYTVTGTLYKDRETYYVMAGYTPGCGRVVRGEFCRYCRAFLPALVEVKAKGRAKAREVDGKAAAAGE